MRGPVCTVPLGDVGGDGPHQMLWKISKIIKCFSTTFFQNFKSGHIYTKDAKCAVTDEKSISCFLQFLVFEIWKKYQQKCLKLFPHKISINLTSLNKINKESKERVIWNE